MRLNPFGKHLHNQIVVPLVVASLVVAVVATVVAWVLLDQIINGWIDETATATSAGVVVRFDDRIAEMQQAVRLVAENPRFVEAVQSGDPMAISAQLVGINQALDAPDTGYKRVGTGNLMLLDETGRVVASTGGLSIAPDDTPLGSEDSNWVSLTMSHPLMIRLQGKDTLTVFEPVKGPEQRVYALVYSQIMDDSFVAEFGVGTRAGLCLYDADLSPIGIEIPGELGGESLVAELKSPTGSVMEALEAARQDVDAAVTRKFIFEGVEYRVVATQILFESDPTRSAAYLVTVLGTGVAEQTRVATRNLIMLWSVVAVAVLLGLNWWVARRVSDPLTALSDSVARVADGDFSTKVTFEGSNEVSELSENFNRMTDSLRDRSENLTKKVLELATLYEMSRALGSTLDLDVLLDSVLDSAMRIFNVEIGYVTLRDRETGELSVRTRRGGSASHADEIAVRTSMSEWVIREGRPLIFNPPRGGEENRIDTLSGALAALCVPLISNEGTLGAITVGSRDATQRFTSDDVRLLSTIANHVTIAIGNIDLFSSLQEAYLATVRALATAVDAKDTYTRGHSDGVAKFALVIAESMGLSAEQHIALKMAAYLHDIGKIGISEEILLKPGKLTDEEMAQMRHHPLIGANILRPVAFPWPIAPIVRHHHEHYDGSGYPAGLKGEEIPMLARLLTVADAFEAMVSDRPYRRGRSQEDAILELRRCSGSHFDPRVVDAFIRVLEHAAIDERPGREDLGDDEGGDERRAVFVAVADGMVLSFRRLGGPRLAANLERDLNLAFTDKQMPFTIVAGHLSITGGGSVAAPEQLDDMRRAMGVITAAMERTSGASLVEHFYTETVDALPERMRSFAQRMCLLDVV
ncbi:MAG: HD domain-containing protein [Coriobacteriia bacterium]|nr:HD domain-containing protein [Coriobacteriia bacterium]